MAFQTSNKSKSQKNKPFDFPKTEGKDKKICLKSHLFYCRSVPGILQPK